MQWIVEQSWTVGLGGLTITILAGILFLQMRDNLWFGITITALLLTLLLVGLEYFIVTDREEIQDTIAQMAAALEANDLPRFLQHVDQNNQTTRFAAEQAMQRIEVERVGYRDVQVVMNYTVDPPEATVRLRATFHGRYHAEMIAGGPMEGQLPPRPLIAEIDFAFDPDKQAWLVTEHALSDAYGGQQVSVP